MASLTANSLQSRFLKKHPFGAEYQLKPLFELVTIGIFAASALSALLKDASKSKWNNNVLFAWYTSLAFVC